MFQALTHWLDSLGIQNSNAIHYNPSREELIRDAVQNKEGLLTTEGALGVITAPYTGRSPKDKYLLADQSRKDIWWDETNKPVTSEQFSALQRKIVRYLVSHELYIIDCFIGADPQFQQKIRLVTEFAWQALTAENLFIFTGEVHHTDPDIMILAASGLELTPGFNNQQSNAAIYLDLEHKTILIAGSRYAGEIKKSAFSIMNGILPTQNVLPMHCSANVGSDDDVALFFGLSGTGKTTLSSAPDRFLIGDDEHGWGKNGIFNFEGGCYAKTIRLNPDLEPMIWSATNQYATVLENVIIDPDTHQADFNDNSITENTRSAYPLNKIENSIDGGMAGHPKHIFFLTADAFGVLPPIAKLNSNEITFYFLLGYTSKVAGTERGLGKQPQATFSTCFAEPFLPLKPTIYAQMLKQKVEHHGCTIWLINTGWTGGGFNMGFRMPLPYTRRMIEWALALNHVSHKYHQAEVFDLTVPNEIPEVPTELLYPEKTWDDEKEFLSVAQNLKAQFEENIKRFQR
jgi:phosphoenolpyruvate carboxykinase (ATP)